MLSKITLPGTGTSPNLSAPPTDQDKEYQIRRFTAKDLGDLEELHKAVYGIPSPPQFFSRKYDTAYTGAGYLGYLAYNMLGIAVAYYGVIPCFMEYDGQIVLAAQSGDTMTHPQYRYKGMFAELSRITFALCRESGIKFLFGFPNQHSYHGAIKLGWKMTETMECFLLHVRALPLAGLSRRFGWLKGIYRKYTAHILKRYIQDQAGVPNSSIEDGYGGIYRNDRYLEYKGYSETKVIRIGHAKAWISIRTDLVIGDLSLQDEDFDTTLTAIKKLAASLGLRQVSFHTSPGTALHKLFAARYPSIATFPVLFQDFGTDIPFEKIKFTFADIDIF